MSSRNCMPDFKRRDVVPGMVIREHALFAAIPLCPRMSEEPRSGCTTLALRFQRGDSRTDQACRRVATADLSEEKSSDAICNASPC
jgi:hypothetical protein